MSTTTLKERKHIGETRGCADHHHDLVHELSRQFETVWRYDQYLANADGHPQLQAFWRELKARTQKDIRRMKDLLADEIRQNGF
jgi:hypothetical protein